MSKIYFFSIFFIFCCRFLIKIVRGHTKTVHEWNGHLEIFSLPQVIEIASHDILQKTVVGCPCLSSMMFIEARPVYPHRKGEGSLLLSEIPYDFLKFSFLHFSPQVSLFFVEKGNLKFSNSKIRWREESKNSHFRKT